MAVPTAISNDRQSDVGIQKYKNAMFFRDGVPLYLGDDGDFKIWFDGTDVNIYGADLTFSDTHKLIFGDGADASINWTATVMEVNPGGKLVLKNITAARAATSDQCYLKSDAAGGGYYLMVSSG